MNISMKYSKFKSILEKVEAKFENYKTKRLEAELSKIKGRKFDWRKFKFKEISFSSFEEVLESLGELAPNTVSYIVADLSIREIEKVIDKSRFMVNNLEKLEYVDGALDIPDSDFNKLMVVYNYEDS